VSTAAKEDTVKYTVTNALLPLLAKEHFTANYSIKEPLPPTVECGAGVEFKGIGEISLSSGSI